MPTRGMSDAARQFADERLVDMSPATREDGRQSRIVMQAESLDRGPHPLVERGR